MLLLGMTPAMAHAEIAIPAQARADDGTFLPYAPPPAQPSGLCLVDTGVTPNPDTEGVVVDRTAIDGGSGNDVSPNMHGTVLAMMAGAQANGWGWSEPHPDPSRSSRCESLSLDRLRFRSGTTPTE
jgi:hypothetical protein